MKYNTQLLIVLLLVFHASGQQQGQRGRTYTAPWDIPALEDPYFFEPYFDTIYIHDTVYVSDADAFLKRYYKGKITLNDLVKNQQILDSVLRNLSTASGKELYFNFFGNHRFPKALSRDIYVKDYMLTKGLNFYSRNSFKPRSDLPIDTAVLNPDLLFRFTGAYRTNRFLRNKEAMVRAISYMMSEAVSYNGKIKALNLYFPDFNFREKRAMVQFIKSVKMVLDAAKDPKISGIKLNVFFHQQPDESVVREGFLYALTIKADEVVLLDPTNVMDDYYVKGDPFTQTDIENVGFLTQIRSHFYLARFSNGDTTSYESTLTDFSVNAISHIALGDIPENNWESYLWFLGGLFCLIMIIILLYFFYPPFSYLMNQNMGIVLASSVIFVIEFFMLAGAVFSHMCTEDEEISSGKNTWILFCTPILMVVVLPLLRQFTRNRRLP